MDENDTEATQTSLTICTESRALVFLYEDGTVELAPELIAQAIIAAANVHGPDGRKRDGLEDMAEAAAKAVAKSILTAIAKQHSFTMEEF